MCTSHTIEYDIDGDPIFSDYRLRLWSAWTRARDERTCQLCLNTLTDNTQYLQAHHIFPKKNKARGYVLYFIIILINVIWPPHRTRFCCWQIYVQMMGTLHTYHRHLSKYRTHHLI